MKHTLLVSIALVGSLFAQSEQKLSIEYLGDNASATTWDTVNGRNYFLQWSTNLVDWTYLPLIEKGDTTPLSFGMQSSSAKVFTRLRYTDQVVEDPKTADFDDDGINNWDEIRVGGSRTDPFNYSTNESGESDYDSDADNNGLPDGWELDTNGNVGALDPNADDDGDSLTNLAEAYLGTSPSSDNTDGDDLLDAEDAMPTDKDLNWKRSPEYQYALVDLGELSAQVDESYEHEAFISREGLILLPSLNPSGYPLGIRRIYHYQQDMIASRLWNPQTASWQSMPSMGIEGVYARYMSDNGVIVGSYIEDQFYFIGYDHDRPHGFSWSPLSGEDPVELPPFEEDPFYHAEASFVTEQGEVYGFEGLLERYYEIKWVDESALELEEGKIHYSSTNDNDILRYDEGFLFNDELLPAPGEPEIYYASVTHNKMEFMNESLVSLNDAFYIKDDNAQWKIKPLFEDIKKTIPLAGSIKGITDDGTILTDSEKIWRNGVATDLNNLISTDQFASISTHDMASNGLIAATAKKVKDDNGNTIADPKKHVLMGVPIDIIPDYNRDGIINNKDRLKVTEDNPWRWWVNDDNDSLSIAGDGSGDVPVTDTYQQDSSDLKVDGMRDLVDFFPLYFDLKKALKVLPSSKYQYFLKHSEDAFKFFEDNDAVIDGSVAGQGVRSFFDDVTKAEGFKEKAVNHVNAAGFQLPNSFLSAAENEKGVLLFEVTKETEEPIVLEVRKSSGEVVLTHKMFVKTSKVEKMYRSANMRGATGGTGGLPSSYGDRGEPYPDSLTNGNYFAFIHGFNVTGEAARGWHAEIFKRMHQMGSKARFIGISWHGDVSPDYHEAVEHAFIASTQLASFLQIEEDAELTIAAHSLGNVVVSNAIEHEAFTPTRYFMINAASPIEAYDVSQTSNSDGVDMSLRMTEDSWKGYNSRFFASDWHKLFADNQSDERNKLKWKDRFSFTVPSLAYNFFSTGEDVVKNARANESVGSHLHGVITNFNVTSYAWVSQEISKGSTLMDSLLKDTHAGWRFHHGTSIDPFNPLVGYNTQIGPGTYRKYTPSEADTISNEALKTTPFHWPFKYQKLYSLSEGSAEAAKKNVQHELLAAAIPAVSFAAAANSVDILDLQIPGESRNFNMMNMKNGDWPRASGDWLHSDFRDVALSYVVEMYEEMVNTGKLNK
jgi:hypothetical protein